MSDDRIPVVVGVGEISDRPADLMESLEPLELMSRALQEANEDAGCTLLAEIDSLDVVNLISWRYADVAAQLATKLRIAPRRAVYGPVGGESPVRYLHEAALRVARGESTVGAIVGGEASHSVAAARKAGLVLPWTAFSKVGPPTLRIEDILHAQAIKLGAAQPITVYPFYETASAGHWGQTPSEALAESGMLWSKYATIAASNPSSWLKRRYSADEIVTPSSDNRLIAWPYTKLMVANPMVNQGAAVIVTSLARARAAGIPSDRMIHVWGGADATEPRDYLQRDQYFESHAQAAVLEAANTLTGAADFDALELYSCFPCVPKMARRALGLGSNVDTTVTGGLTFFGAPLNNYMTHAICAMVRRLRSVGGIGLLYGQGEFVTKPHALVISSEPPQRRLSQSTSVQVEANRRRGHVPLFSADAVGSASVETFTIIYDRNGVPNQGVVIVRMADGGRAMARVPVDDERSLDCLVDPNRSPIGIEGALSEGPDGVTEWRIVE